MALEYILAAIAAEGDQACKRIAAEADRRVKAILAEAEAHAAELRAAELRQGAEVAHGERVTLLYRARLEAGRRRSAAWQEAYRATLEAAQATLASVRDRPDYPQILRRLLIETLPELDASPVIIITPGDEAIVARLLDELHIDAVPEAAGARAGSAWGGVEMRTADNRIVVRNTLESRLARAEPALPAVVSAIWRAEDTGAPVEVGAEVQGDSPDAR